MLNYWGVKKLFKKLECIKLPQGPRLRGPPGDFQVPLLFRDTETSVHKLAQPVCGAGRKAPLDSAEDPVSGRPSSAGCFDIVAQVPHGAVCLEGHCGFKPWLCHLPARDLGHVSWPLFVSGPLSCKGVGRGPGRNEADFTNA